ncbi:MAG: hypothetical protein GY696_13400 [Gammaproteobacteria bacterium]|nr:hypothetical protein [Gammaproteobacteria bacterium]
MKSEINCPLGCSAAFLSGGQRQVEEVNVSVEETPAAGGESGASGEPRHCFFCDRVGHVKVNCWRYARWKEEDEDEDGDSDSDRQSTSGKEKMSWVKAKIPDGNPCKEVPRGLSEIVDYCFDGTVHVTTSFSAPAIKCPVVIEGFRVNAVLDSGSDIILVSAKCFKSFAMAQNKLAFCLNSIQ